jgi:Sec-independent protein secretion pathway component TatC
MQSIVQIVLGIVVMVPYFIGIFTIFIDSDQTTQNSENVFSLLTILLTVIMIISILFNYTLQNIILINQGIIYYSLIEEQENISAKNNIDLIGQNEE